MMVNCPVPSLTFTENLIKAVKNISQSVVRFFVPKVHYSSNTDPIDEDD